MSAIVSTFMITAPVHEKTFLHFASITITDQFEFDSGDYSSIKYEDNTGKIHLELGKVRRLYLYNIHEYH